VGGHVKGLGLKICLYCAILY